MASIPPISMQQQTTVPRLQEGKGRTARFATPDEGTGWWLGLSGAPGLHGEGPVPVRSLCPCCRGRGVDVTLAQPLRIRGL